METIFGTKTMILDRRVPIFSRLTFAVCGPGRVADPPEVAIGSIDIVPTLGVDQDLCDRGMLDEYIRQVVKSVEFRDRLGGVSYAYEEGRQIDAGARVRRAI